MEHTDVLVQPSELMFERNVGHLAMRGKEVEVFVEGLTEPRVGFICGLDEEFLQLVLTKNQTFSHLRRDMLISMDETGETIGTYVKSGVDRSVINIITDKTANFRIKASHLYGSGSK